MSREKQLIQFVGGLKSAIQYSQYKAAKDVNTNLVQLYFVLGGAISKKVKQARWGDKVLENISAELQKELKGLKGFSHQNLKKMKLFYEAYPFMLPHCSLYHELTNTGDNNVHEIGSTLPNQFTERVEATEQQKAEDLFNSLLQKAFKGELV